MIKKLVKEDSTTKFFIVVIFILFLMIIFHSFGNVFKFEIYKGLIENFSTIFVSIVIEAMPFIMIGAFISAIIQVYISEETIAKIIPKNQFLGLVAAGLMGFIFPVCECAIVPIGGRLLKKGVPVSITTTFMLAVPLVNPIVLLSTYYAFNNNTEIVIMRAVFGFLAAIAIGFLVGYVEKDKEVLKNTYNDLDNQCNCGCGNSLGYNRNKSKVLAVLDHTSVELYNIGRYLIIGAFLSAAFQTFISRNSMLSIGQKPFLSILVMMALAFVISICSAADAFIAKTFLGQFTLGSITAFLILGPMIDLKNTLMLSGTFKKKFVIELILYVFFVCYLIGAWVNVIKMLGVF